jgi:UDP-N-acetyl-D-galactosamine dehydrogenase
MIRAGHNILGGTVTLLGLTFKEDCPDLRNSRVIDIYQELQDYGITVQVHDALADEEEAIREYGIRLVKMDELQPANAVIAAVSHRAYREMGVEQLKSLMGRNPVLIDVKAMYDPQAIRAANIRLWRL